MGTPPKRSDHCENTRPAWVCQPPCFWVEILSGEKIYLDSIYLDSDHLVKILSERTAAEEVLKNIEDYAKRS